MISNQPEEICDIIKSLHQVQCLALSAMVIFLIISFIFCIITILKTCNINNL